MSTGTPLADAVRQGAEKVAKMLIRANGSLGYDEERMAGVLCEYAKDGSKEAIKRLLEAGGNVNAADYDARTCLHLAASEGNTPIVEYLADKGKVNINVKDRWGGTPLSAVKWSRSLDLFSPCLLLWFPLLLTERVLRIETVGDAVREGHIKSALALKQRGAELGLTEAEASGELCEAARQGHKKVVEALIAAGAPIDAADYDRCV